MTAGPRIADARFREEAHAHYARWRDESPVVRTRLPGGDEAWLLARYEDVSALLKDPRFAKDPRNAPGARARWVPGFVRPLMTGMLERDDPDHARMRGLVHRAFTTRRVEALVPRTEAIAEALLDRAARRGTFDLIEDFALPLPVAVISDMLGVEEPDRPRFARWSRTLIANTMSPLSLLRTLPAIAALIRFLRGLIAERRARPTDDLVSALVAAEAEGGRLSADELLSTIALLLTAGHETTVNLIGNGTLALFRDPAAMRRLREEPALMPGAVEELLRFSGPVETSTNRYAREAMEIAGTPIPAGAIVLGVIASANRDPAQFADPDRLDLGRAPNRHLTFGQGGHSCVGAPLARMEGAVAFTALLRRFPYLRPARPQEPPAWRPGLVLRGLERLPVAVD